jgi:uncharacterized membrane protein (DUF2068 family)
LRFLHRDVAAVVTSLISRLHLNPANKYPRIFIDAAAKLTDPYLWLLAALAFVYATFRAVEAYGLWRNRAWAEWLALATSGIYLPVEIYELARGFTWIRVGALSVNLLVIVYMAYSIRRDKLAALQN